jgi:hypothetical protein
MRYIQDVAIKFQEYLNTYSLLRGDTLKALSLTIYGNSQKSLGAKSEKYGGCSILLLIFIS